MDTWPISVAKQQGRVLIGIPARLGDEHGSGAPGLAPHLEEQCGEEWLVELLQCLMPQERSWAWWTSSDAFAQSKLAFGEAPARVVPGRAERVLRRNVALRHMTLAVIPAENEAQDRALDWAGLDTEHFPDHLLTALSEEEPWDLEALIAWCRNPKEWKSAGSAMALLAERVVTIFDDSVFCVLSPEAAERVQEALAELADSWGVRIVQGSAKDAWHASK